MPNKSVTLKYTGEAEAIDYAVYILAKKAGWRELSADEISAGSVQQSMEEAARDFVTNFIRDTVERETVKQVEEQVKAQAAEARASAALQARAGLDLITKNFEITDE
jgi:hypothetical protein